MEPRPRSADVKPTSTSIAVDKEPRKKKDIEASLGRIAPMSNRLPSIAANEGSHIERGFTRSFGRGAPMSNRLPCQLPSISGPRAREILQGTWAAERRCQSDFRASCRRSGVP